MVRTVSFEYHIARNGVDIGHIYPTENSPPVIRMAEGGEIKTSLSGLFLQPEDEFNWLTDQIRPEIIIDGTAYQLGLFLPATITTQQEEQQKMIQIQAYDLCWKVRDYRATASKYFSAGVKYTDAIGSLLAEAGISRVLQQDSEAVLADAREDWDMGTSYLEIINQLLSEINYKQLWFDENGMARLEPYQTASAINIRHTLDDTSVQSLLQSSLSRVTDIYNVPNVFVCVCSNADKSGAMVARSENTNVQSPLSIGRRGRRIVQVTQVNNIASQAELQSYAERLMTSSLVSGEVMQVTTGLLPGFGVGDVTALRFGDLFAICRETAWSMELRAGGLMTHTLERQVINFDE